MGAASRPKSSADDAQPRVPPCGRPSPRHRLGASPVRRCLGPRAARSHRLLSRAGRTGASDMSAEADVTGALSRAMAALSNAGAAIAALGAAVGEAQKAAERREREAQRVIADATARVHQAEHDVQNLRDELARKRHHPQAEKDAYRRGYRAGYHVQ